jgi:hypothetical protein
VTDPGGADRLDRPPGPDSVPSKRLTSRVRNYRRRTYVAGSGEPYELSDSAAVVWKLVDGHRSVGELATALCAEYDIDAETALADVVELVTALTEAGVLSC